MNSTLVRKRISKSNSELEAPVWDFFLKRRHLRYLVSFTFTYREQEASFCRTWPSYLFLLMPSSLIVNITNTIDKEISIASRWIKGLWVMADLHFWIKTGCRRIIRIPYDLNMKATIMYCNLFLHSVEIAQHNFNVNIKRTEVKHSAFDNDL